MSHVWDHCLSSARTHGGQPEDYEEIHLWFDEPKAWYPDFRSRIIRHHSEGIGECVRLFGTTIINSDGNRVPVSLIGEQHVFEDCGYIPTFSDWARNIRPEHWMDRPVQFRGPRRSVEI